MPEAPVRQLSAEEWTGVSATQQNLTAMYNAQDAIGTAHVRATEAVKLAAEEAEAREIAARAAELAKAEKSLDQRRAEARNRAREQARLKLQQKQEKELLKLRKKQEQERLAKQKQAEKEAKKKMEQMQARRNKKERRMKEKQFAQDGVECVVLDDPTGALADDGDTLVMQMSTEAITLYLSNYEVLERWNSANIQFVNVTEKWNDDLEKSIDVITIKVSGTTRPFQLRALTHNARRIANDWCWAQNDNVGSQMANKRVFI